MGVTNNFWQTITPVRRIGKARGYIVIPPLGYYQFTSYGAPFIVAQNTYQCLNNVSFPFIPPYSLSLGANYNLAVRYNDPVTGIPIRYKFWNFANDAMNDCPAPLYAGQPILGQNFVIEIWSRGGQPSLSMNDAILLDTSVLESKALLDSPDKFELGTVLPCPSLQSTNGLNLPLQFLSCAAGIFSGIQQGANYVFNEVSGMLEMLNTTTGLYNPIYAMGELGAEYLVIYPQVPGGISISPGIPLQGANFRFNQTTNCFEFLNLTTGYYNALNTQGVAGLETIIIQPQDQ